MVRYPAGEHITVPRHVRTRRVREADDRLVKHDQQIAVGERETIMRTAAERRRPVSVRDQLWLGAISNSRFIPESD